jgi:hypothetical protein
MKTCSIIAKEIEILAHIHCRFCDASEVSNDFEELKARVNNLGWKLLLYPDGGKKITCPRCYRKLIGVLRICKLCDKNEVIGTGFVCAKCLAKIRRM